MTEGRIFPAGKAEPSFPFGLLPLGHLTEKKRPRAPSEV